MPANDDAQLPIEVILAIAREDQAAVLRQIMDRLGYSTRTVGDPQRATVIMRVAAIHVVLVDRLPVDDGGPEAEMLTELLDAQHQSFRILVWNDPVETAMIEAINQGDIDAIITRLEPEERIAALLLRGIEVGRRRWRHAHLQQELIRRNRQLEAFNANLEGEVRNRTRSLQQANQQLRHYQDDLVRLETQATLTHLVRGLAHEINNPLSVILGQTQRLQRMRFDDERVGRRLEGIAAEVARCIDLVNHLRSFSTGLRSTLEPTLFEEAVEQARQRLATCLRDCPAIRLTETIPPLLANLDGLARSLEQIFDNAARAGAQEIIIDHVRRDEQVQIRITNDGADPTDDEIRNAIRPFFTTRSPACPGLGLALASALLREQSGTIIFDRNPTGRGALVAVTLTAADNTRRAGTAPFVRARPAVLVIDDDPMVIELLMDTIGERSHRALRTDNMERAIALANLKPLSGICCSTCFGLDIIRGFLDRLMPRQPGIANHILLVGPVADRELAQDVLGAYAIRYLVRPFKMDEARAMLGEILD